MIKSITINNVATFSSDNATLSNCDKINLVFGSNGSGKTTIGKYLESVNNTLDSAEFQSCSVDIIGDSNLDILVYNRDFKERNFRRDSSFAGVFTLGENSIENMAKREKLNSDLQKVQDKIRSCRENQHKELVKTKKLEKNLEETIWNSFYQGYKDKFKIDVFAGFKNSKAKLAQHAKALFLSFDAKQKYALASLQARDRQIESATTAQKIGAIDKQSLDNVEFLTVLDDAIWVTPIIGNDHSTISKLIAQLGNSDWVNNGRKYMVGDKCPFCQQSTIDADFCQNISDFFNDEYSRNIQSIEDLAQSYHSRFTSWLSKIDGVVNNVDIKEVCRRDIETILSLKGLAESCFEANHKLMLDKKANPSLTVSFKAAMPYMSEIHTCINNIQQCISDHNRTVENLKESKSKLISDCWMFMISENLLLLQEKYKALGESQRIVEGFNESLNGCSVDEANGKAEAKIGLCARLLGIEREITELNKQLTSTQPTINQLNTLLTQFGFTSFSIALSDRNLNSYELKREDGSPVNNTLSEGEETFISFLYFIQLMKGSFIQEKASDKKILVIDDPVCSLDSKVLYIVSSIIKDLFFNIICTKNCNVAQVFVLTHNAYFHKEISQYQKDKSIPSKIQYFKIDKYNSISSIKCCGNKNPITSHYLLLWEEVKKKKECNSFVIQNIMRRIIEHYFRVYGSKHKDEIEKHFDTHEQKLIARSLFQWINDGSHSIIDDFDYTDESSDTIAQYYAVFRTVFEKTGHGNYYKMMMGES